MFITHRQRLYPLLADNSVAIIFAHPESSSNADALYFPYVPNSSLLYLTGIAQQDTALVALKRNGQVEEYLFILPPDEHKEIWNGKRLSKAEARKISGIEKIAYRDSLEAWLTVQIPRIEHIYLDSNEHERRGLTEEFAENFHIKLLQKQFPLHNFRRLAPILKTLRMQKTPAEITRIRQAIDITHATFLTLLKECKNFSNERDINALIYAEFIRRGAYPGYQNIIASGDNARILHYIQNDAELKQGELILLDFGARKDFYNADISRTIPYSGKFSARQKAVYNACLDLLNFAKSTLKPQLSFGEYLRQIGNKANELFLNLGLLTSADIKNQDPENPAYRRYFYHGISHHLGIDVHDLSDLSLPFAKDMVLTVEPGIYIQEEAIGIRLENNVLITENGCEDLAKNIPISAEEIEACMR